jgi:hypothetical protein
LCYPNGNHNDTTAQILKEEHIQLAFTTIPRRNDLSAANLLQLGRTCITPRSSMPIFGARLLPLGAQLDVWRHHKLKAVLTRNFPQSRAASD